MATSWSRNVTVGLAVSASALGVTGVALAGHGDGGKQTHKATLKPVPHDPEADHGSNVRGSARVVRRGNRIHVQLRARGLSPNLPHAVHIHGKDAGELAFCPGAERRSGIVDDALIETAEGVPDYGPVQVSFTTRGDTSAKSVLALERFPVARRDGHLRYRRSFSIPRAVAQRLEEKHIVIHGADLDRDGEYGGRTTALGAPLEGELPVACGELDRTDTGR
jgi:hypothetical protein